MHDSTIVLSDAIDHRDSKGREALPQIDPSDHTELRSENARLRRQVALLTARLDGVDTVLQPAPNRDVERALVAPADGRMPAPAWANQLCLQLADVIPQLGWMARPDGYVFWFNQRWYEYTGAAPSEMEGWGWRSVHCPNELPRVLRTYKTALTRGDDWEDVFPLRRWDGEMRWHRSRATPLRDDGDNIVLWFGTHTDVTDQRLMEEQLRDADRRKDEFLAMLGHELRNPLAGIVSGADALGLCSLDNDAQEMLAVIARQAAHMSHIVKDLLDVSRIARGLLCLRRQPVELGDLLNHVVSDYATSHLMNQCQLEYVPAEEEVWVEGDPTRLSQALTNLIHNGVKFCDGPNVVSVSLTADPQNQTASVRVTDRGIGMTPELLSRIFEPFSQADNSIERSRGGLGLGLSLVQGLVKLHGGTITAQSPGLNRGTTVTIQLPMIRVAVAGTLQHQEAKPQVHRVLVIDDRRDAILPVQRLLEKDGHEVMTAADGPSGIAMAVESAAEVILCDIGLDERMSGYDVARTLRAMPRFEKTYIVAVSGYGLDSDRRRARDAGFDYHLTKPVGVADLRDLLARMPRF